MGTKATILDPSRFRWTLAGSSTTNLSNRYGGRPAMKKIRYAVAMSLDGFIAGPNGKADWIVMDPEVNFRELWAQFDTFLMGRRTYDAAVARLGEASMR